MTKQNKTKQNISNKQTNPKTQIIIKKKGSITWENFQRKN